MQSWTEKYMPEKLSDVEGNPSAIDAMKKWGKNWKRGAKPLLLVGPPGTGKTISALALAKTLDWELLEMNASDLRNKESMERIAGLASLSKSFSGKKRLIVLDEVDGLSSSDRGGTSVVQRIIREANTPLILIANDAYATPLMYIRNECEKIEFRRINPGTIQKILEFICKKEGIKADKEILEALAKSQNGDLKSAINDLQAIAEGKKELKGNDLSLLGSRDRKENIFNALRTVFKTMHFDKARDAFESLEEDPDFFLKWVDENIPREYEKPEDLANAYNILSKADIYNARIIKRQYWTLMKYSLDLTTAGIALSKKDKYHKFVGYQFPGVIKELSTSKAKRAIRDSIARKIGKQIHASPNEVIQVYLPYLTMLLDKEDYAKKFTAQFQLDEKELEFFGFSEAKTKKLLDEAGKIRGKAL